MTKVSIIKPEKDMLNKFVSKNKYATIFQTGHMLDIYHDVPDCEPLALVAVDDNDEILASLVSIKFTEISEIGYLSSHITIRDAPLWVNSECGKRAAIELINKHDKITKKRSLYNRIYSNSNVDMSAVLCSCDYKYEDNLNFLIDLNRTEEELWSSLGRKKRNGVRTAIKNNLVIKEVENYDELKSFYKLLLETSEDAKIPIKDFKLFYNVYKLLVPKGLSKIYLATYDGLPIAGLLTLNYNNTIYDWYACSTRKYLHLHPNEYLVWNVLSWGAKNGYSTFDFGGAGNPNAKYTVRNFKKQFGGTLVNYGTYTKINKPLTFKMCKKCYEIYCKLL